MLPIAMVVHNRLKLAVKCLKSLQDSTDPATYRLFLIDNGSDAGVKAALTKLAPPGTKLIRLISNLGIAAGRNAALRAIDVKYNGWPEVLGIFDSDILFHPEWLETTMQDFASMPTVGILGCCFGSHISLGKFTVNGRKYCWKDNQPGHSWLIRSEVLRRVGVFDISYGIQPNGFRRGFSDGDLVRRMLTETEYKVASTTKENSLVEHIGKSK